MCIRDSAAADGSAAAFQHLEFLVRDWQEFEGLEDGELLSKVGEMDGYLAEVLETESRVRPLLPRPCLDRTQGRGEGEKRPRLPTSRPSSGPSRPQLARLRRRARLAGGETAQAFFCRMAKIDFCHFWGHFLRRQDFGFFSKKG